MFGAGVGSALLKEGNPIGLHFIMFIPAIMGQGTLDQQAKWLSRAYNLEIIGTYAQVGRARWTAPTLIRWPVVSLSDARLNWATALSCVAWKPRRPMTRQRKSSCSRRLLWLLTNGGLARVCHNWLLRDFLSWLNPNFLCSRENGQLRYSHGSAVHTGSVLWNASFHRAVTRRGDPRASARYVLCQI